MLFLQSYNIIAETITVIRFDDVILYFLVSTSPPSGTSLKPGNFRGSVNTVIEAVESGGNQRDTHR